MNTLPTIPIEIHPRVRELITGLDPEREYAVTRDLAAHEIIRQGQNRVSSPVVFYDVVTGLEAGLAFGDYIRLKHDDIRVLQSIARTGRARCANGTIESMNEAAALLPPPPAPQAPEE